VKPPTKADLERVRKAGEWYEELNDEVFTATHIGNNCDGGGPRCKSASRAAARILNYLAAHPEALRLGPTKARKEKK